MQFEATDFPGLLLLQPRVFHDERGYFMETYHLQEFTGAGLDVRFVQDNHSQSVRGTLRGLHYQLAHPQGKLVRVVRGEVFDVAVDLRRKSAQFGRWFGIRLSETNLRQVYIPPGFAHGFYTISDIADVVYKCTDFYHRASERTLLWSDPVLGIDWPGTQPLLSAKDAAGTLLRDAPCFDQVQGMWREDCGS
jgi:dTDP-4-dehydrorhamnose 3,5-epimerase